VFYAVVWRRQQENLFQGCEWVRLVWEEEGKSFGQARMGEGSIRDIIEHCEEKIFQNAIVRRLWDLLHGFVV
jgi:hypothetical protein